MCRVFLFFFNMFIYFWDCMCEISIREYVYAVVLSARFLKTRNGVTQLNNIFFFARKFFRAPNIFRNIFLLFLINIVLSVTLVAFCGYKLLFYSCFFICFFICFFFLSFLVTVYFWSLFFSQSPKSTWHKINLNALNSSREEDINMILYMNLRPSFRPKT